MATAIAICMFYCICKVNFMEATKDSPSVTSHEASVEQNFVSKVVTVLRTRSLGEIEALKRMLRLKRGSFDNNSRLKPICFLNWMDSY